MAGGLGLCQAGHLEAWQCMGWAHPQPQGEEQRESLVEIQGEGALLGVRQSLKYQVQKIRQAETQTQRKMITRQRG